ncbi:alpha/beta fold hydrolase [Nocardia blacklockiae]|uniref:alpha/beta fold hydrolase n=1 Tax=Nocardia blacklockiae TaxID=480036 RepID=UPI001893ED79|nr:alpha/beta hydrolase [Nocardia blacklockiae]MBF6175803.1 alpha/beta hydrolase [Nocardia blacklockiae]
MAEQAVEVVREGSGPEVVLVHGGAGPRTTWAGLESMRARWTLASVYRRGFPPSPPPVNGCQDFEVDADDIAAVIGDRRPHVVAHSYGTLGTLIAAGRRPNSVRSLTIIEPPLYFVAGDDPLVARLRQLGDTVLTEGLDTDTARLREFLTLAGSPVADDRSLPAGAVAAVRRAHGGRLPGEARPRLEAIRAHGVPVLVASGGHAPALESICDGLASIVDAQRVVAPGAGHFVAAAPGFAEHLERFLASV